MTEQEAKSIKQELAAFAKKHGMWLEVNEKHKPELKEIVFTVSLRVGK